MLGAECPSSRKAVALADNKSWRTAGSPGSSRVAKPVQGVEVSRRLAVSATCRDDYGRARANQRGRKAKDHLCPVQVGIEVLSAGDQCAYAEPDEC